MYQQNPQVIHMRRSRRVSDLVAKSRASSTWLWSSVFHGLLAGVLLGAARIKAHWKGHCKGVTRGGGYPQIIYNRKIFGVTSPHAHTNYAQRYAQYVDNPPVARAERGVPQELDPRPGAGPARRTCSVPEHVLQRTFERFAPWYSGLGPAAGAV